MLKKWIFKIILISSFFIESSFAMCFFKEGNVDPKCRCRKSKTCMKVYDKEVKKNAQQAAQIMSKKKVKKLYGYAIPSLKKADEMFSGSEKVKWDKKEYDKIKKSASRLENLNKKLSKKVEANWKKSGVKKYKFSDRQKLLNRSFSRHIPKNVINYVEKKGFPYSQFQKDLFRDYTGGSVGPMIAEGGSASENDSPSEARYNDEDSIAKKLAAGVDENGKQLTPQEIDRLKAAQAAQAALSSKKYKMNDIHPKHLDLFKIVSSRYYRSMSKLDQKGLKVIMSSKERKKSLSSAFDLVELLD